MLSPIFGWQWKMATLEPLSVLSVGPWWELFCGEKVTPHREAWELFKAEDNWRFNFLLWEGPIGSTSFKQDLDERIPSLNSPNRLLCYCLRGLTTTRNQISLIICRLFCEQQWTPHWWEGTNDSLRLGSNPQPAVSEMPQPFFPGLVHLIPTPWGSPPWIPKENSTPWNPKLINFHRAAPGGLVIMIFRSHLTNKRAGWQVPRVNILIQALE